MKSPCLIRVVNYRNRIVLEDVSRFAVKPGVLSDWATEDKEGGEGGQIYPQSSGGFDSRVEEPESLLVFPFDGTPAYYTKDVNTPERDDNVIVGVDYAVAFLGMLYLPSGAYVVLVRDVRVAGYLPSAEIFSISKVLFFKAHGNPANKADKDVASSVVSLLESGFFYFCYDADLTQSTQRTYGNTVMNSAFWWTHHMSQPLPPGGNTWCVRTVYGFAQSFRISTSERGELTFSLISRRSRRRSGTRYMARGIDNNSDVANFVETEQILWEAKKPRKKTSFRIVRGSIPCFWNQTEGGLKPPPAISASLLYSRAVFHTHFKKLCGSYGDIMAVSLVSCTGTEAILYDIYARHFELEKVPGSSLLSFDFHAHCAGREQDRGRACLVSRLRPFLEKNGIFSSMEEDGVELVLRRQRGVLRVNCVDCLDRTNVVQCTTARVILLQQLEELGASRNISREAEESFRDVWAKNADAVSLQYAGTKAMKTDMTKTGKRSAGGMLSDGVKSVVRMYYKSMVDEGRQDVIDLMTGYATHVSLTEAEEDIQNPLWATYADAQLVSPGGDRQEVRIDVREENMYIKTAEGLCFSYPRGALISFERDNRRFERPRLRLHFANGKEDTSAASSPLHLQFRKNPGARERFLRMVSLWSDPAPFRQFGIAIRVRMIAYDGAHDPLTLKKLALSPANPDLGEILCIVRARASTRSRDCGLACVPADLDETNYVLVDVASSSRVGPNIAVLASRTIAPAIMQVESQSTTSPIGQNNASVVSLCVAGTSICFVGSFLHRPSDFPAAITPLSIGRNGFDISTQFEHFYAGGFLHAENSTAKSASKTDIVWKELGYGFGSRILPSSFFGLRYSLPGLQKQDLLNEKESRNLARGACYLLVDEVVQGSPAPFIPNTAYSCTVLLEDLQADGMKNLKGGEHKAASGAYLTLQCDLAEGLVSTKLSNFSGSSPAWIEPQLFHLVATDREEIRASYIYGQVMMDEAPAGSFVIPLERDGKFIMPVRLASKLVGKLHGEISLTFEEVDPLSAGIAMNLPAQLKARRTTGRKVKNFVGKYLANPSSSRISDPNRPH